MTLKIWELHGLSLGGAIRSTPEGHAEVAGLVLTEKAYLMAVRDFRPHQLVAMVRREGASAAAERLVQHYGDPANVQASGGRKLVVARGPAPEPMVWRSDEAGDAMARAGNRP